MCCYPIIACLIKLYSGNGNAIDSPRLPALFIAQLSVSSKNGACKNGNHGNEHVRVLVKHVENE